MLNSISMTMITLDEIHYDINDVYSIIVFYQSLLTIFIIIPFRITKFCISNNNNNNSSSSSSSSSSRLPVVATIIQVTYSI